MKIDEKSVKKNKNILMIIVAIIVAVLVVFLVYNSGRNYAKIEIMDLTGDVVPYQSMTYGDSYVADLAFDSLLRINNFEITTGIASDYTVDGDKITVTLGNNSFKIPGKDRALTADDVVDYYTNILMRLAESNSISNPGVLNLKEVKKTSDKQVEFEFNSKSANNLIALAEKIGYIYENNWYGTLDEIEYNKSEVKVGNEIYVPLSSEKGLTVNKRISSMMIANVMADENVVLNKLENGSYGFITWGKECKISNESRQLIFGALEESQVRKNISMPCDSIYLGTDLYQKTNLELLGTKEDVAKAGLGSGTSLNIGVVSLGSFSEIKNALSNSFMDIGVPAVIEEVEIGNLLNSDKYDLIYVRLTRGMSPNITALFNENGLLSRYRDDYTEEIKEINDSEDWKQLCELSKSLELRLRNDGVWLFLDKAYNIETTKR